MIDNALAIWTEGGEGECIYGDHLTGPPHCLSYGGTTVRHISGPSQAGGTAWLYWSQKIAFDLKNPRASW
ncbi:hypothetical protein BD779DRAFT_138692 [Infundibulicybe gibba]|nr:hypothetical protein BD779DRAFT_138692 [Infundibulicybe gibba]